MSVFPREEMIGATGESLDPDDWDGLRALRHRMVDDVMDYLRTVRDRPAWRPIPERARRALEEPVPRDGIGAERAYGEFVERVLLSLVEGCAQRGHKEPVDRPRAPRCDGRRSAPRLGAEGHGRPYRHPRAQC